MDFEGLANLSWRETLLGVIAVLLLYLLALYLRMRRMKHASSLEPSATSHVTQTAVAAYAAVQEPSMLDGKPVAAEPEAVPAKPARPPRDFPWNEPPPEIPGQQMIDALERNVLKLRGEVAELRADLQRIHDEMRHELSQSRAMQSVSPLYSDAMQMAIQGHDAATVSERCGIARAEAELVVALVRNRNDSN